MKEQYYDLTTIDEQAAEFMKPLMEFRKKHKWVIDKKKTALLVIDMQQFFLNEHSHAFIPGMSAIIPKVKSLQDHFLRNNGVVIQMQHGSKPGETDTMKRWYRSVLTAGDPLAEIIPELMDPRVPVLLKSQYDAFWKTDLQSGLHDRGITQLVITGVMTHLCCDTTARSAFMRGFDVFFTVDGTATYNKEFHSSSLLNLSHGFAIPLLCKEVVE